jgi:hypothetical protein
MLQGMSDGSRQLHLDLFTIMLLQMFHYLINVNTDIGEYPYILYYFRGYICGAVQRLLQL